MIKTDKPDFFDTYEKSVRPDLIPAEPMTTPPADDLFKVEETPPETTTATPPETTTATQPETSPAVSTLDDAALEKIAELVAAKIAPQTGGTK